MTYLCCQKTFNPTHLLAQIGIIKKLSLKLTSYSRPQKQCTLLPESDHSLCVPKDLLAERSGVPPQLGLSVHVTNCNRNLVILLLLAIWTCVLSFHVYNCAALLTNLWQTAAWIATAVTSPAAAYLTLKNLPLCTYKLSVFMLCWLLKTLSFALVSKPVMAIL